MVTEETQKAGAIILSSKDKQNIALLYRSKQNDWSFPKGHVDLGENPIQTMIREIKEETGLTVSVVQVLPDLNYTSSGGEVVSVKMFIAVSEDDSKLRLEFKKDDIQWIPYAEITKRLSYDNLKDYYTQVFPVIRNIIYHFFLK